MMSAKFLRRLERELLQEDDINSNEEKVMVGNNISMEDITELYASGKSEEERLRLFKKRFRWMPKSTIEKYVERGVARGFKNPSTGKIIFFNIQEDVGSLRRIRN